MNSMTLKDLLQTLPPEHRSSIEEVSGPEHLISDVTVEGARSLSLATEREMTFCKDDSPELVEALRATHSRFVIIPPESVKFLDREARGTRVHIVTRNPRLILALLAQPLADQRPTRIADVPNSDAVIGATSTISRNAVIGPDVSIGERCIVSPGAVLQHCELGDGTIVGPNCSIGQDGFGYEVLDSGEVVKFPHFGNVKIGADVEIGANTCIDRGSLGDTVIEDEVKIDNLVHIAHNTRVERGAFIIANAMIGGSARIGRNCWIAPSTSVINGVQVGERAMTGLAAVVVKPVEENVIVIGMPAKTLRRRYAE